MERVLIPTDGTGHVKEAAALAVNLADNYDATLHALYVNNTVPKKLDRPPVFDADLEDIDCEAMQEVYQQANKQGFDDLTGSVSTGYPFKEIVRYIEIQQIDLVVVHTGSQTGVERLLNRNTAKQVLQQSPAPVLAVPQTTEKQQINSLANS